MLTSRLPQIAASLPSRMKAVAEAGAEKIAEDAKARVHVDSGALRDAIHVDSQPEGVYVVAGDTDAFYGHLEEFGSSHSAPHPFLVPALEENVAGIERMAAGALKGL